MACTDALGLEENAVGLVALFDVDVPVPPPEVTVSVYWTVTAPEGFEPDASVPEPEPGDCTRLTNQPPVVTPNDMLATDPPVPELALANTPAPCNGLKVWTVDPFWRSVTTC